MLSEDFKDLSLEDLLDIYKNCMKRNSSRCSFCMLNSLYGEECIELKDKVSLKYLKELQKIKEARRFKEKRQQFQQQNQVKREEQSHES